MIVDPALAQADGASLFEPSIFEASLGVVLFCAAAALAAGFIDSIAGGGGLVTLPALMLAGVPAHHVLGTNKFQASLGTGVALGVFARGHYVLWRIALVSVPLCLLGAAAGSRLALAIDEALLHKILVALLPIAMMVTLLPKKERAGDGDLHPAAFRILLPALSFVLGLYDGFFGPGTGSFMIMAFHWILRIGLVRASATAKVLNLATNVGALAVFLVGGQVLWALALPMAAASITGNALGSRLAIRLGEKAVRRFLVVSLSLLLATLLYRTFLS